MKTLGSIVLGVALILAAGASPDATAQEWTFESVAPITPPPGCGVSATMTGLEFDPSNRPVAGWYARWGCGGSSGLAWGRRNGGSWTNYTISDANGTSLQPFGLPADLGLSPGGTPYYAYASVGDAYIYGNFGWWQTTVANLDANPTTSTDRRRFIEYRQSCISAYPNFAIAFTPGVQQPNVLTGTRCQYAGWLALDAADATIGPLFGDPMFNAVLGSGGEFRSTDYATGPGGEHHVVFSYERGGAEGWGVSYNNGTPLHAVGLAVPHRNRGAEVSIAVDANNRIHVAIGGIPTCDNLYEGGLLYATSGDEGTTWEKTFVDVISGRLPSISLDANGNPSISYQRNEDDVRLARMTSDGWTTERVASGAGASTRLAFDQAQQPNVLLYDPAEGRIELATGTLAGPALHLANPGEQSGNTGGSVSMTLAASAGSGPLGWSATCLPAGVTINPATGTLAGTLPEQPGATRSTITVTDTNGATASITFDWTFDAPSPNAAPVATAGTATVPEDDSVAVTLVASDADGDALSFSIVSQPSHGVVALAGNVATYTPHANYNGDDAFTFEAADGSATSNVETVSVTVTPVNDAPELAPVAGQVVTAGTLIAFPLVAYDVDGDALQFSATGLPAGATLDAETGSFAWPASVADIGNSTINFAVTDPGGLSAAREATFTVTALPSTLQCTSASASIGEIWPPNHRPVEFDIRVPNAGNVLVTAILQDEPTDTRGDGLTAIDGGGIGTPRAWVRAERSGTPGLPGNGRVYEIRFVAFDANGGGCTGSVSVSVPHDKGKGPAIDDRIRYDSTVAGGPPLP